MDVGFGIVAQTVAAVNTPKGKKPPPLKNFIPNWEEAVEQRQPKTSDQLLRQVELINLALGGIDLRNQERGS